MNFDNLIINYKGNLYTKEEIATMTTWLLNDGCLDGTLSMKQTCNGIEEFYKGGLKQFEIDFNFSLTL